MKVFVIVDLTSIPWPPIVHTVVAKSAFQAVKKWYPFKRFVDPPDEGGPSISESRKAWLLWANSIVKRDHPHFSVHEIEDVISKPALFNVGGENR